MSRLMRDLSPGTYVVNPDTPLSVGSGSTGRVAQYGSRRLRRDVPSRDDAADDGSGDLPRADGGDCSGPGGLARELCALVQEAHRLGDVPLADEHALDAARRAQRD